MDRTSRTLRLKEALAAGQVVLNAVQWAKRFNVDLRTIQRDIAYLKEQEGMSLVYDRVAGGYLYVPSKQVEMSGKKAAKSVRLLDIIRRISAEPGLTAQQLAESLGRDKRTIYRDIRALEDLGYPIYTDNGYHLAADAMLPSLNLTPAELLAVLLGLQMVESQGQGCLEADARRAQDKLVREVSESRRPNVSSLRRQVQLTEPSEDTGFEVMVELQAVLNSGFQLQIEYLGLKDKNAVSRQLDPMGLFCFRQVWYLRAYDHARSDFRSFRISRIAGWRLTDVPVVKSPRMELGEAVYNRWDLAGGEKVTVEVQVSQSLARWLVENPPHPSQQICGDKVTYQVSELDAVARWAASLYGLTVLNPPELRTRLAAMGEELCSCYSQLV